MRQKKVWFVMSGILTMFALVLPTAPSATSKCKILHRFQAGSSKDGAFPNGGLIFDTAGNLYGTTYEGGIYRGGTAFRLKQNADGSWSEKQIHNFCQRNCGGLLPVSGLIFDSAGNLYGATDEASVYQLSPNVNGGWTLKVLANVFRTSGPLVFDTAGNLYGEALVGGTYDYGKVYQLTPNPDGSWTENDLYSFANGSDGKYPGGGLVFDAAGNLYGGASTGGDPPNNSLIYKLTPGSNGQWTESVVHIFTGGMDGGNGVGNLIFDAAGNLYGTTATGGKPNCGDFGNGCGVVFKIDPSASESVIHTFEGHPGSQPGSLIFDSNGNLYGTAAAGGTDDGGGVFKLKPRSDGTWAYSVLHTFQGNPGLGPIGPLVFDQSGNLYGTTGKCDSGTGCLGTVFEITP